MTKEMKKTIELLRAARKNLLDAMYADTVGGDHVLTLEQFKKIDDVDTMLSDMLVEIVEREANK